MTFDAVIFDLDGTLIDTERLILDAGVAAFAELGHDGALEVLHRTVGTSEEDSRRLLSEHFGPALDHDALNRVWRAGIQAAYDAGIPLRPGVAHLLGELARLDHPRAVATNSLRPNALRKLASSGIAVHFHADHVIGADMVAAPKPAPDVFLAAAARLGVDPTRCLAVEDSLPGCDAALAAGMTVLHVPDMVPALHPRAHHTAGSLLDGVALAGLF